MDRSMEKPNLKELNEKLRRTSYSPRSSVSSRSRSRSRSRNHSRRYSRRHRSRSFSRSPSCHRRIRYYGSRENPYKSKVVGVFGLSQATNEVKLLEVFSRYGVVEHVTIIHDAKTGNSRGFGFIYYAQIDQATNARCEANGSTLDGKRIRVDYSITRRPHTPTPGVYMGHRSSSRESPPRRHRSRRSSSYRRSRRSHSRRRYSRRDSHRHSRRYSRSGSR